MQDIIAAINHTLHDRIGYGNSTLINIPVDVLCINTILLERSLLHRRIVTGIEQCRTIGCSLAEGPEYIADDTI